MLRDKLAAGEHVAIVADRVSVRHMERSLRAPFLGRPAPFPEGPFVLASLLECPVYLLFCLKIDGRYRVFLEPFADPLVLPRSDAARNARSTRSSVTRRVSKSIACWPLCNGLTSSTSGDKRLRFGSRSPLRSSSRDAVLERHRSRRPARHRQGRGAEKSARRRRARNGAVRRAADGADDDGRACARRAGARRRRARGARLPQQSACSRARSTKFASPSPRCASSSAPLASPSCWARAHPASPRARRRPRRSRAKGACRAITTTGSKRSARPRNSRRGICSSRVCATRSRPRARRRRRRLRRPRALIAAGRCDAAIVGGVDSLCELTLNGFDALESLAPDRCNPFSANRRGINIGEGACVFVVSRRPGPMRLVRHRRVVGRLPHLGSGSERSAARRWRYAPRSRVPGSRRATSATSICTAPARRRTTRWRARSSRAFSDSTCRAAPPSR